MNVVGIEKVTVLHYHLPYGRLGYIEVEVRKVFSGARMIR